MIKEDDAKSAEREESPEFNYEKKEGKMSKAGIVLCII